MLAIYSQLATVIVIMAENYIAVICMIWVNALGCIIFMPFILSLYIVGETSIIILITTQTQSLARQLYSLQLAIYLYQLAIVAMLSYSFSDTFYPNHSLLLQLAIASSIIVMHPCDYICNIDHCIIKNIAIAMPAIAIHA